MTSWPTPACRRLATNVLLLAVIVCSSAPCAHAAAKWPRGFSRADRRDILALARLRGITDPVKVEYVESIEFRIVTVEGKPVETERERRLRVLYVFMRNWNEYADLPADERGPAVGHWASRQHLEERVFWRIRDGALSVLVNYHAEGPVTFEDTEQIVLAVRRGTWLNGQPHDDGVQRPLPSIDASRIYFIAPDRQNLWGQMHMAVFTEPPLPSPRQYRLGFTIPNDSGGMVHDLFVRIVSDGVEVLGVLHAIE